MAAFCNTTTTTANKATTSIPGWVTDKAKGVLSRTNQFSKEPFTPFTGEMVAPLDPYQTQAFQNLTGYVNRAGGAQNYSPNYQTGQSMITSGGNAPVVGMDMIQQGGRAPASTAGTSLIQTGATNGIGGLRRIHEAGDAAAGSVGTERLVDENGNLGAMADYINPQVDAVLTPQIRNINESADTTAHQIGQNAFAAGAYGDARQGIREGVNDRNRELAIGDVTGQAYFDAWNSAMAERTSDANRFLTADTTTQNLREGQLNRQLQAGTTLGQLQEQWNNRLIAGGTAMGNLGEAAANRQVGAGTAAGSLNEAGANRQVNAGVQLTDAASQAQADYLNRIGSEAAAGAVKQQYGQNVDDAAYRQYAAAQQDQYDKLNQIIAAISGVPYNRTVTSTGSESGNIWQQILQTMGAGAGSFL